jgi:hypothetical protein
MAITAVSSPNMCITGMQGIQSSRAEELTMTDKVWEAFSRPLARVTTLLTILGKRQ